MLFNSFDFTVFFPTVIFVFFIIPHRFRWAFLLAASYYFYMCWKAEYLVLIIISTLIDYFAGIQMGKIAEQQKRKKYLYLSLLANLGILFSFKYANFFSTSLRSGLEQLNIFYETPLFDWLLPVGISFYTFQSLSYSIDVYRGEKTPEYHLGRFALYVAFFPQLVAGPIERSVRLLPQFEKPVYFQYERVVSGLRLMLWGFFKKLVIADRLAIYVNEAFNYPGEHSGLTLLVATYFFAFQIYCDFSGYSDIAIGTARVMGYDLMLNFRQPYFSKSISEFWKRWHISLSTWFKDYLYIPLGGNRVAKWRWYYNLMAVFLVSGLWHGANWTFVLWGGLHGAYLFISIITADIRKRIRAFFRIDRIPALKRTISVIITFHLVLLAWVFFRANSIGDAFFILQQMTVLDLSWAGFLDINIENLGWGEFIIACLSILFLVSVDWFETKLKPESLQTYKRAGSLKLIFDYVILFSIIFFGVFEHTEFIYFQF